MTSLVLLRHGESTWNAEGLFTGWVDVGLSGKGAAEAVAGGALLRDSGLRPDVVHTSVLTRAIQTAHLALEAAGLLWLPVTGPGGSTSGTTARCRARTRPRPGRSSATSSSCSGGVPTTCRRRRSPTTTRCRRPTIPGTRHLPDELRPAHRVPARTCWSGMLPYWYDALVPDLAAGRTAAGRRARQLAARAGQAPGRDRGRGDRRAQHPDRHPARLRAGRRLPAEAGRRPLPRPRGGGRGRGGRPRPGALTAPAMRRPVAARVMR